MRLPLAYEGVVESTFIDETLALMTNPDAWAMIPASRRTKAWQTKVFTLLARGACIMNELRAAHKNYPYKTFGIINRPDLADEVLADSE
eukprot:831902-Pyramimonas_sp.AAC.1